MSNQVLRKRRYTTVELSSLTLPLGETVIDVTKSTLVVHDGSTAGGIALAKEDHTHAGATTGTAGFMSTADKSKLDALSLAGGIQNILSDTVPVTARTTANFSSDFTVEDNSGASRTDFSISQEFRDEINNNSIALLVALS